MSLVLVAGAEEKKAVDKDELYYEAQLLERDTPLDVGTSVWFKDAADGLPTKTDTKGDAALYRKAPAFDRTTKDASIVNEVNFTGGADYTPLEPVLRLGTAPAAIHADEADEAQAGVFTPGGEGRLTFGQLDAVDAKLTSGKWYLDGDTLVHGPITGVGNLFVDELKIGPETCGNAFLRKLSSSLSSVYNENTYDYYLSEKDTGYKYLYRDGTVTDEHKIEEDGFAWIAACSSHSDSGMDGGGCKLLITVQVKSPDGTLTTFADTVDCRTNDAKDRLDQEKVDSKAFCFLVPVRKDDTLIVTGKINQSASYYLTGYVGVKLIPFGTL